MVEAFGKWGMNGGDAADGGACSGARLGDLAVEPVAGAVDGEALLVQQVANAADQQDFVMLVIAPVSAPLHRLQLRELLFPIAQHVRLDRTQVADLANREVPLGWDRREIGTS